MGISTVSDAKQSGASKGRNIANIFNPRENLEKINKRKLKIEGKRTTKIVNKETMKAKG